MLRHLAEAFGEIYFLLFNIDFMTIKFLGANREVTGSCYLLENKQKSKILIDCGFFQGGDKSQARNRQKFNFKVQEIDAVCITHAHLDHIGRLPKLVKDGYHKMIYAIAPTIDLSRLVLEDTVKIAQEEFRHTGEHKIFDEYDVVRVMGLFSAAEYNRLFEPAPGFKVRFRNAGHILGSAFLEIEADNKKYIFSGDLGNPDMPLLLSASAPAPADVLVLESTYGSVVHERGVSRTVELQEAIEQTIKNRGVLMIPAFALERTQEILLAINGLVENKKIPHVPVFLDSPMAISATEIYKRYAKTHFSRKSLQDLLVDRDLFDFEGFKYCDTVEQSKQINHTPSPKVIIAGSGMMEGGRILHHAKRYLSDPRSTLLFVGYQVAGTLGRQLFEKARRVFIHGERIAVHSRIKSIGGLSAHADSIDLVKFAEKTKTSLRKIYLTHGELERARGLRKTLLKSVKAEIDIPKMGEMGE
ncbi:MAG: metallo-beta-lactamase family protein [Candidatus Berkelbacteria bacterium Licking1014_7]|uniref:Metallo-beta-lactamase family protein n=1 Tax=Candidatus Berkelbacteria bacterium Licking1014_7 TaxID=2017147 RepID=A0A554LKK3_9BACT|nr:MAG: metallo-beta-lactamase family protein [Candidatus Berkelbacteria bacterium Licking1014_7]